MSAPPDPPHPRRRWGVRLWAQLRARYTDRQLAGAGLTFLAFLITAGLALWGASDSPPNLLGGLLLTLLAGSLQTAAGWLFSHGQGTAQSDHAESSVGNLLRLLGRVLALKDDVERGVRKKSSRELELRQQLGVISVELEFIGERADEAVGHWKQFYPEAVDRARRAQLEGRDGG